MKPLPCPSGSVSCGPCRRGSGEAQYFGALSPKGPSCRNLQSSPGAQTQTPTLGPHPCCVVPLSHSWDGTVIRGHPSFHHLYSGLLAEKVGFLLSVFENNPCSHLAERGLPDLPGGRDSAGLS